MTSGCDLADQLIQLLDDLAHLRSELLVAASSGLPLGKRALHPLYRPFSPVECRGKSPVVHEPTATQLSDSRQALTPGIRSLMGDASPALSHGRNDPDRRRTMQPTDRRLANAIRALAMDAVEAANSGHPGMPMGMADAATALFTRHLKFDAADPRWPDRDRFILSAGHGSMLIYSLLYLTGYERPTLDDIKHFRQLGSPTAGHPENFELPGIEVTTGPLGQGVAMAVGMAIAERHLNAIYGDDLVDHRTFVIAGDGDLMEGINHEAVGLAGNLRLGRLIVLWRSEE